MKQNLICFQSPTAQSDTHQVELGFKRVLLVMMSLEAAQSTYLLVFQAKKQIGPGFIPSRDHREHHTWKSEKTNKQINSKDIGKILKCTFIMLTLC